MSFLETVEKARAFLERNGRVSLRALRHEFNLDDGALDELIEELVEIQRVAVRDGRALAWAGAVPPAPTGTSEPERAPRDYTPKHLADKILQSKSALEGERKQVTVLFADVKGSMQLSEQVDPEEWHAILDRFFQILTEGVHRFEGTVNQYTGDGIMALFGAPIAHEDHARRACWAALHLRERLRTYADGLRLERGIHFSTRMGIHSGEVVVGKIGDDLRMDYTAQGHVVGLADRMQKLAGADRICVSQETEQLVAGYLELRDLGEARVAGVSQPLRVFELEGAGALRTRLDLSRTRGFSKFVGRSDELGQLEAALEKALAGNGQVLGIVADAGIGKSRLCFEFTELCRSRGLPVRSASGVAHGRAIPLLPVLQFYRESFGIVDEDDDFGTRQKIAGALAQLDRELLDALPILYDFLGVPDPHGAPLEYSGPELQRRLLALLKRIMLARSEVQPTVILFEDLHWFDPGTETFLENLIDSVDGTRTLLLANYRPEYRADWLVRTYCQQIAMAPLGLEAMAELVDDLLGSDASLAGLAERIRTRTGGNPFFVEEIVQTLVESGALEGERGQRRLTHELESLEIPPSVHAVLAARIDRLAESEKALLQTAAVIGSEFSASLLERASQTPGDAIADALRPLVQAEFLHETALYPEPEYAFKHPLTQEVAYRSQLRERRVAVHRRVAEGLAELRADQLDEQAALIAHHWEQAEESFEAARWHARAATWRGDNAPEQSRAHWARVCELLGPTVESQEAISLALQARTQLLWQGSRMGMPEQEVDLLLSQGEELAARCDEEGICAAFFGFASVGAGNHGRFDQAERLARRAVEMADAGAIPFFQGMARAGLAQALLARGSLQQVLAVIDEGLRLSPEESRILIFQGIALAWSGRLREARGTLEHAISAAQAADVLPSLATAHAMREQVEFFLGDVDAALRHGRRSVELEERIGSHVGLSMAYGSLGRALMQAERWEEARAAIARAIEVGDAAGGRHFFNVLNHVALAEIDLEAGNLSAARSATEREIADREELPTAVASALHLARIRALLALEGATPETRAALGELEGAIDATGAESYRPLLLQARAEWCQRAGDEEARRGHLREAWRLFQAMGADGALRRMKRDYGDLVS